MQGEQDQAELQAMSKRSADGVLHFNPQLFDRYAVGKRRPYSLIFFLNAVHLQDKSSLGLRQLRKQFGLLAKVGSVVLHELAPLPWCCSSVWAFVQCALK